MFLTFLTLVFISYKNHLKIVWTNKYFNQLLRKEQISDNSMYYHFSLEIIGEENVNSDVQDGIHIKQTKFINWKYLKEMVVHVVQPLPSAVLADHVLEHSEVAYYLSDILMFFMMLRLIYAKDILKGHKTFTDVYSKKICRTQGLKVQEMLFARI